jgi:hypothetical protein
MKGKLLGKKVNLFYFFFSCFLIYFSKGGWSERVTGLFEQQRNWLGEEFNYGDEAIDYKLRRETNKTQVYY